MMEVEITIPGRPITKKNSQRIITNMKTNRPMVIPSKQYKNYEEACLWLLKGTPELRGEVELRALYWLPDRRSTPDLINLLQATSDILEKAGVIENDRLIVSYDGSRIAGYDKDKPRVEIAIKEVGA